MESYGRMLAADTLRFQRRLKGPIQRVWSYLTDSEKRGRWLATGEMELVEGGKVELHFRHADLSPEPGSAPEQYRNMAQGHSFTGIIFKINPPNFLSFSWEGGSEVSFQLSEEGAEVLLVLTHRKLPTDDSVRLSVLGGWHTHLDILIADLAGATRPNFWKRFTEMETSYGRILHGHYASIGELEMYYELHGEGFPLVLVHGGGSTIDSSFGRVLPELAKTHRVIAVELQAHGRTADIDRPLSFEQDADDIAALLDHLGITQADCLGFSNGGTTCLQLAIRHPRSVRKLVLASTTFRRDGMTAGFFDGFEQARLEHMPKPLQEAFLRVNPDPKGLQRMFDRDVARMSQFRDIPDAAIRGIRAPALVINADKEVILAEHALSLARTLPDAQLAILPGGHGDYIGELCAPDPASVLPALVVALINEFLSRNGDAQ